METLEDEDTANTEKLEKLEQECGLEKTEYNYALKSTTYIMKRALNFLMKPSVLQENIRSQLKFDTSKSDIFVKLWILATKQILEQLESPDVKPNDFIDVSSKVKLQISSEQQQKEKKSLGHIQIKSNDQIKVDFLLSHAECADLFDEFEKIQIELDALKK